MEMGSIFKKQC